jgi:hypothetical protein
MHHSFGSLGTGVRKSGVSDTIGPMRGRLLLLALGCLISNEAWGADKPIPLTLEGRTTLRLGELAVLQIHWTVAILILRGIPEQGMCSYSCVVQGARRYIEPFVLDQEQSSSVLMYRGENVLAVRRSIIL